jgi:hypothetical protein
MKTDATPTESALSGYPIRSRMVNRISFEARPSARLDTASRYSTHEIVLFPYCVVSEFLFQVRRNMGNNHGVASFVAQLQHVANTMDLGD